MSGSGNGSEQIVAAGRREPASPAELFLAFTRIALQGFGGVLAVAQHELVDRRGWLDRQEYLEMLSVAQVLPGPNVVNLSLTIGDRYFGLRGAMASLAGMLLAPLAIVLALTVVAAHGAHGPAAGAVAGALRGMTAVAAGMVLGSALKLTTGLRGHPLGAAIAGALALCVLIATAWAHVPLAAVLAVLGPIAVALVWWRLSVSAPA